MLLSLPGANAQFKNIKENVKGHIEADPLTISGNLGGEREVSDIVYFG